MISGIDISSIFSSIQILYAFKKRSYAQLHLFDRKTVIVKY